MIRSVSLRRSVVWLTTAVRSRSRAGSKPGVWRPPNVAANRARASSGVAAPITAANCSASRSSRMMSEGAKKISGLISASTRLKEYQAKVKAKVQAAADDVAKQAKKGGLSEESVEAIRKHILGIAS